MTKSKDQIRCWQSILDSIYSLCKCFTCIKPSYWRYDIELSEPLLDEKIELATIEPYGNVKYSFGEIIYMDVNTINHNNGYVTLNNLRSSIDTPISFQPPPTNIEYVKYEDNDSSSSNSSGLTSSSDDDELMGYHHTRLYAYEDKNSIKKYEDSL